MYYSYVSFQKSDRMQTNSIINKDHYMGKNLGLSVATSESFFYMPFLILRVWWPHLFATLHPKLNEKTNLESVFSKFIFFNLIT